MELDAARTAVARTRMVPGTGQILVNGRPVDEYFPRHALQGIVRQPFNLTRTQGRFDVNATLDGGGISGQAEALRHGISRALLQADPEFRPALKKARPAHPATPGSRNARSTASAAPAPGSSTPSVNRRITHGLEGPSRMGRPFLRWCLGGKKPPAAKGPPALWNPFELRADPCGSRILRSRMRGQGGVRLPGGCRAAPCRVRAEPGSSRTQAPLLFAGRSGYNRQARRLPVMTTEKLHPKLVFADTSGNIYDHPELEMLVRRGDQLGTPRPDELIPLPPESELFLLPGRSALGLDPESGEVEEAGRAGRGRLRLARPHPVRHHGLYGPPRRADPAAFRLRRGGHGGREVLRLRQARGPGPAPGVFRDTKEENHFRGQDPHGPLSQEPAGEPSGRLRPDLLLSCRAQFRSRPFRGPFAHLARLQPPAAWAA